MTGQRFTHLQTTIHTTSVRQGRASPSGGELSINIDASSPGFLEALLSVWPHRAAANVSMAFCVGMGRRRLAHYPRGNAKQQRWRPRLYEINREVRKIEGAVPGRGRERGDESKRALHAARDGHLRSFLRTASKRFSTRSEGRSCLIVLEEGGHLCVIPVITRFLCAPSAKCYEARAQLMCSCSDGLGGAPRGSLAPEGCSAERRPSNVVGSEMFCLSSRPGLRRFPDEIRGGKSGNLSPSWTTSPPASVGVTASEIRVIPFVRREIDGTRVVVNLTKRPWCSLLSERTCSHDGRGFAPRLMSTSE